MGGVGYSIAPNLTLDANYRYVNFGDVTVASDASGAMTLKNLAAHEVRVGVRWSFDDLVR
jgi:opacity protein-like surface antigen